MIHKWQYIDTSKLCIVASLMYACMTYVCMYVGMDACMYVCDLCVLVCNIVLYNLCVRT